MGSNAKSVVKAHGAANAATDPDTFLTQVNDEIQKAVDTINDVIQKATDWVNDQLASHGGLLGGIGGSILGGVVGGPLGGIAGGIAGHEFGEDKADALKAKLDSFTKQVHDAWDAAEPQLRQSIGSILGDPLMMSKIASSYRDAAEKLGSVSDKVSYTALSEWQFSGQAAGAYGVVREPQTAAYSGLQSQLLAAATQMDSDEATLLDYWNQQLWNLLQFIDDVTHDASDAANVANWVTVDAGPIAEFIGTLTKNAGSILSSWATNWVDTNVTSAGSWDGLNSGLGSNGLPGGQWPRIDGQHRAELNTSWGFQD